MSEHILKEIDCLKFLKEKDKNDEKYIKEKILYEEKYLLNLKLNHKKLLSIKNILVEKNKYSFKEKQKINFKVTILVVLGFGDADFSSRREVGCRK